MIKILSGFGILILSFFGVYLIWSNFIKAPESATDQSSVQVIAPPETQTPQSLNYKRAFVPIKKDTAPQTSFEKESNIPILPIPKPNLKELSQETELPSAALPFFENILKAAETVETKATRQVGAPDVKVPGILTSTSTAVSSKGITLNLTLSEFRFLYPDFFLQGLIEDQKFLKDYDPTFQPLEKIENDSDVRFIEEKIIIALLSANMITKEEADRFITAIRFTLPQLQLTKLEEQRKINQEQSRLPSERFLRKSFLAVIYLPEFLAALFDGEKLRTALIPTAEGKVCGYCYWSPLCFQVGPSPFGVGPVFWSSFCRCTGCLHGLGCLDKCTGRAALWDPATGICGCG